MCLVDFAQKIGYFGHQILSWELVKKGKAVKKFQKMYFCVKIYFQEYFHCARKNNYYLNLFNFTAIFGYQLTDHAFIFLSIDKFFGGLIQKFQN